MRKRMYIVEPLVVILLAITTSFVLMSLEQNKIFYFHPYAVIAGHTAIYFLLGAFLSGINKKLIFHFTPGYLVLSVLGLVALVCLYVFYAYLPSFLVSKSNTYQMFLSTYAGATFLSALFKDEGQLVQKNG